MKNKNFLKGCKTLVSTCGNVKRNERVLILTNRKTLIIAQTVAEIVAPITPHIDLQLLPDATMHGQEPAAAIARKMCASDVIFALTKFSMAHTKARQKACRKAVRYLSLVDYDDSVIQSPSLQINFRLLTERSQKLADIFTRGKKIQILTKQGTDLTGSIVGRHGNSAPGWCWKKGSLASPPDAESNVALVEDASEGILVVDGSIPCPQIGLLKSPQILTVKKGKVVKIQGTKARILNKLFDSCGPKARVLAELGVGLNPKARLSGYMLEDEGCLGTIHIGMGSNATIGGKNSVPFHLDHIIKSATLLVDDKTIMKDGKAL